MPFGFGPGRAARRRAASTPAAIFGSNLRAWFDNQDLSTMWQDEAMTTPAAVGQPVAMQQCRVNSATFYRSQSTASRRPILRQTAGGVYYLECDGVDDGMVTPSLDLSGTTKQTIFAGLRKLSDAAIGDYVSPWNGVTLPQRLGLMGRGITAGGTYSMEVGGSVTVAVNSPASYPAPHTAVIMGTGDIPADTATLRVNGAVAGTSSSNQGTGSFGDYPLYFFRRGNNALPFNGWDFGCFIVDRTPAAGEIAAAEAWLNNFMGAY